MAFCTACGKEVPESAVVRIGCGDPVGKAKSDSVETEAWTTKQMWTYGIISFIIPIVGWIMGIIGMFKEKRRTQGIILFVVGLFAFGFWNGFMKALQ